MLKGIWLKKEQVRAVRVGHSAQRMEGLHVLVATEEAEKVRSKALAVAHILTVPALEAGMKCFVRRHPLQLHILKPT